MWRRFREQVMTAGVYIHIPFCQSRCSYCHFVTRPWQASTAERYQRALLREIEHFAAEVSPRELFDSVYLGGGTPSLVPPTHIAAILEACRRVLAFSSRVEISLEANPGTLSGDKVATYRDAGVNRVSVGAQSFDDGELRLLGRAHTSEEVHASVRVLRAHGIDNVNLDLMLGLPGQTEGTWRRNLEELLALAPPHVSVYMLDLDVRSPLQRAIERQLYCVPEDDLVSDLYLLTIERLEDEGYAQYEISNFAQRGHECRHNLKYWRRLPVFGFGVGSHSYDGTVRYANWSRLSRYLEAAESGQSTVEWKQALDRRKSLEETLFLGLRLRQGVNWAEVRASFGESELEPFGHRLRQLATDGLVEWKGSAVRLTRRGILLSNEVFQQFV